MVSIKCVFLFLNAATFRSITGQAHRSLNRYITRLKVVKYGDAHEKFNFLKIEDLRPLNTCQKHFQTILPNFPLDECEI